LVDDSDKDELLPAHTHTHTQYV